MCVATDLQGQKFTPSYMSSRSGTIATSQFPLIVALGMKNNILSRTSFIFWSFRFVADDPLVLTGVSYDKVSLL